MERKRIIIGDVHGCYNTLLRLVEKIFLQYDRESVDLVFTGDLIDRGPRSDRVIDIVMELGAACVLGGHEEKILRHWQGTLPKGKKLAKRTKSQLKYDKYKEFIRSLPLSISFNLEGRKYVLVHAGVMPGIPLEEQNREYLLRIRYIHDGKMVKRYIREGKRSVRNPDARGWWEFWNGPEHIIYGHAPFFDGPNFLEWSSGVDTGCCYKVHNKKPDLKARLSCLVIPGFEVISVPYAEEG